jgi:hypothetical protein
MEAFASELLVVLVVLGIGAAEDSDRDTRSNLNLADLAPYRAALGGKPGGPTVAVTFRDLWDHPDRYERKRVRVEGRVERRFRQGALGTFPPLVEAWAVNSAGDPFCLVFPDPKRRPETAVADDAAPGALVRFEGVFLRQVRYQATDTARLAPLIVGDRPPVVTNAVPKPTTSPAGPTAVLGAWGDFSAFEWSLGLAAGVVVALALARQHLRRAPRKPLRLESDPEPPPEFIEPT